MATQKVYASPGSPVVFGAAASAWGTTTSYVVGDMVTESGSTYFCLVAHTSGTFATDLAAGDWLLVTAIVWTPQNEGTGKGRISAVWDRGAGDLPSRYYWRASTRWAATPAANDPLRLYLITSRAAGTAALADGNLTFGDAELASETVLANNCKNFGTVVAAASDQLFLASDEITILSRYVALAMWNGSATKALTNTDSDHWVMFTPYPDAIQAAA